MVRDKAGVYIRGRVWLYGGKPMYDPVLGPYVQFVLRVPATLMLSRYKTRVFIHWFKPTFEIEPKQALECFGEMGGHYVQEFFKKKPRMCVTLVCFGDNVKEIR